MNWGENCTWCKCWGSMLSLRPWDSPGTSTGVGCRFLLQGIFPTQGLNPYLLPWQEDSLPLSYLESPWHPKDCYKSRYGWDIKGGWATLFLCYSCIHTHMHTYTHTALVPHWVASFIYPFECLTNRSDSTYLEITKASSSFVTFCLCPSAQVRNLKFPLILSFCKAHVQ